ncbi:MAG: hypothetical protein Q9217_005955 [Psora testacea]
MTLTDPRRFLEKIDPTSYEVLLQGSQKDNSLVNLLHRKYDPVAPVFLEPHLAYSESKPTPEQHKSLLTSGECVTDIVEGKAYALGDFVDTDAIIPADKILQSGTDEELGSHCLEYTNPDFREMVRSGYHIVVAGKAFGCGSSREEAPRALKGLGVKCVIAPSFSFIYGRNQPTIALLGIIIEDDSFYKVAATGVDIKIDLSRRSMVVANKHSYSFTLDEMELALMRENGLAQAFLKHGKNVFGVLSGVESYAGDRLPKPEAWGDHLEQMEQEIKPASLVW